MKVLPNLALKSPISKRFSPATVLLFQPQHECYAKMFLYHFQNSCGPYTNINLIFSLPNINFTVKNSAFSPSLITNDVQTPCLTAISRPPPPPPPCSSSSQQEKVDIPPVLSPFWNKPLFLPKAGHQYFEHLTTFEDLPAWT